MLIELQNLNGLDWRNFHSSHSSTLFSRQTFDHDVLIISDSTAVSQLKSIVTYIYAQSRLQYPPLRSRYSPRGGKQILSSLNYSASYSHCSPSLLRGALPASSIISHPYYRVRRSFPAPRLDSLLLAFSGSPYWCTPRPSGKSSQSGWRARCWANIAIALFDLKINKLFSTFFLLFFFFNLFNA